MIEFPYVLVKPDGEWIWYTASRTADEVQNIIDTRGWDKNCTVAKLVPVDG